MGRTTLDVLRSVPGWNTPRMDLELAFTFDLGMAGCLGMAFWSGARELRRHRAAVAAHLRYLFDYKVAPQGRWPDERTRKEAIALWFVPRIASLNDTGYPITRPTSPAICAGRTLKPTRARRRL